MCLPLGGGATVAAELNGYLEANGAAQQMAIWAPMLSRIALFVIMTVYAIFIAPRFTPDEPVVAIKEMNVDEVAGRQLNQKALPPFQEKCGYIIFFLVTVALLFSEQIHQPTWAICTVGALLMVITGVLSPKEAVQAAAFAAFLTPMATGTVPYYMGLGGYDQKTILKMGVIPSLLCFIVTVVWNTLMFPLF